MLRLFIERVRALHVQHELRFRVLMDLCLCVHIPHKRVAAGGKVEVHAVAHGLCHLTQGADGVAGRDFQTGRDDVGAEDVGRAQAESDGLTDISGKLLICMRRGLSLDRLSVGTNARGEPALEAGRYLAPGVYLGAKQGVSGGSQATVRIDITKGLKLQGTAGVGGSGSATGAGGETNGSSVGLSYEFEY